MYIYIYIAYMPPWTPPISLGRYTCRGGTGHKALATAQDTIKEALVI